MKHTACGGWIEIRTDPKNTAYVVTEGAKKRDHGEDKVNEGDLELRTEEKKEKLRNDAFAALEVTIDDRKQATADKTRINGLIQATERNWDDPYAANQRLRKEFRVGRKQREKDQADTEALKDRMSLGIDLLGEAEEDRRRAALIEFGELQGASEERVVKDALGKGLFSLAKPDQTPKPKKNGPPKLKEELASEQAINKLKGELGQNTRTTLDPFLSSKSTAVRASLGLKRKRGSTEISQGGLSGEPPSSEVAPSLGLVDYESD